MNINNVFSLLQQAIGVITANPLLSILVGLSIATLIFGLLAGIFRPKR